MSTYETTATVEDQGRLLVTGVPFAPGTEVEVTVSPREEPALGASARLAKEPALQELTEVAMKCREANWDAHGAEPVLAETVEHTRRFVEALPAGIPLPSIGAEPDGHLTLEWYRAANWLLSVSVSPEGMLYYAAPLGNEHPRGSCAFDGQVPETILYWIGRVRAHDRSDQPSVHHRG